MISYQYGGELQVTSEVIEIESLHYYQPYELWEIRNGFILISKFLDDDLHQSDFLEFYIIN